MEKMDFRRLSSEQRFKFRQRAMTLLESGYTQKHVAKTYGVRPNTIGDWKRAYNEEGLKGLKDKPKGLRSKDKKLLSLKQERQVQKMITDIMPNQLKLPYALWTRKAVQELIQREFGITLGISTMGTYLRRWGFTPQKPKKKAYEQCSKKVQNWLDEEYPKIKEKAKEEKAEIHWGDETGVRNSNQHGRSYAPRGKTPVKLSMSKRFSLNMISTVTNQGKVEFMIYSDRMNAARLILFMEQLIKGKGHKIYLILDNLRVHHSKKVKEWEEEHKEDIELFYLPSYSPEKNPDEYLNCDLKHGLSMKSAPKNEQQLKTNLKDPWKCYNKIILE